MKALQTVLNLGVGVKLTKEQVEELKVAVNRITGKEKSTKDDNYRLRYENADLRTQLAKANEQLLKTDDGIHNKESCDAAMIGQLRNQLAKANERIANREAFVNELQVIQSCRDRELERLDKKLAKANERVALLERVEKIFNESPELTFENVKVMFNDELNKFAIEKQLETAKRCAFGSTEWVLNHIEFLEEQLRKEQE